MSCKLNSKKIKIIYGWLFCCEIFVITFHRRSKTILDWKCIHISLVNIWVFATLLICSFCCSNEKLVFFFFNTIKPDHFNCFMHFIAFLLKLNWLTFLWNKFMLPVEVGGGQFWQTDGPFSPVREGRRVCLACSPHFQLSLFGASVLHSSSHSQSRLWQQ